MKLLALLLALQIQAQSPAEIERQRTRELSHLEELIDQSRFRAAQERDRRYRKYLIDLAHKDFIEKFNRYLDKYTKGLNPLKERKEVVKAWRKLEKAEGFEIN